MKHPPKPPPRASIPCEVAEIPEAKTEWLRVSKLLGGKLDQRDLNLLLDYCITHAEIQELKVEVAMQGKMLMGAKGGYYLNPLTTLLINRQSHLASLRRDLYFTPKSRIEKQNRAKLNPTDNVRNGLGGDDGVDD